MDSKRTLVIKRTIEALVDDPGRATQLEQLFLTGPARPRRNGGAGAPGSKRSRPADFYRDASRVAAQIAATMEGGFAHIVSVRNPDSVCEASTELATQRIMQKTHRLATPQEVAAYRRRGAVDGEAAS